mmetsp:Transcript_38252/g.62713  ORF Transcript_38252/g.62713 Transcript_38252/m.62713 type:complete len:194 (-) Transcript_38252:311-892(-)
MTQILAHQIFVLAGTLSSKHGEFERKIRSHGGDVEQTVGRTTTAVIVGAKKTNATGSKCQEAQSLGVPIVSEAFVDECITRKRLVEMRSFKMTFNSVDQNGSNTATVSTRSTRTSKRKRTNGGSSGAQGPGPKQRKTTHSKQELHCLCNQPENQEPYVQCNSCDCWFHLRCVGLQLEPAEEKWFCPRCVDGKK